MVFQVKTVRETLIIILCMMLISHGLGQFIRPLHVYKHVIEGIHHRYNNTCILLLYGTPNFTRTQGLQSSVLLQNLEMYFSNTHHIRTAMIDLKSFKNRIGLNYIKIKRPLFVLMNDHEDLRSEFAQISSWISMAYPTWLIFFGNETSVEQFFTGIYVPFDCRFMVSQQRGNDELITEVYQVASEWKIMESSFGSWSETGGVEVTQVALYKRRNDLFGKTLRVAVADDPPFTTIVRNDRGGITRVDGPLGLMMEILMKNMNCTVEYKGVDTWGDLHENGSWTGMLGMAQRNEVDLLLSDLLMTDKRMMVVEFTTPIFSSKFRVYIKRLSSSLQLVKWKSFTDPFQRNVWMSICLLIIVSSATIALVNTAIMKTEFANRLKVKSTRFFFTESLFQIFGAFCNQGIHPSSLDPIRVIHFVVHLTAVIVIAAYSAAVVSSLAVREFHMPFTTMEGFLQDGTYRFGVVANTADYLFFQNSKNGLLKRMFVEVMEEKEKLPKNILEGLKRLCEEEKYAFMITDTLVTNMAKKIDCILRPLDTVTQVSLALALPKGSPYRDIINSNFLMIRDSGILRRILFSDTTTNFMLTRHGWTSVNILDILPLMILLVFGTFLGSILFSLERIISWKLGSVRTPTEKTMEPRN